MSLSCYFAKKLVESDIVKEDEYELYQYSINALLELLGNILLTIIIGVIIHKVKLTLLFLCVVIPVRSIIGGCHAKTATRCFFLSIFVYLCCVICPSFLGNIPYWVYIICETVFGIVICLLAPVDCIEKPVSDMSKQRFSLYSKVSVLVMWLLFLVFLLAGYKLACIELTLIMTYFAITLFVEKRRKRENMIL